MTTWFHALCFFRNSLRDHPIYRKEYLARRRGCKPIPTLEVYRCYLMRAGFLVTIRPGVYARVKSIPYGLTVEKCLCLAYPERQAKKRARKQLLDSLLEKAKEISPEQLETAKGCLL